LRLAAIERRLAVHQEAYTLWWNLLTRATKKEEIHGIVKGCEEWHVKNCLYLDTDASKAFRAAYISAHSYLHYLGPPRDQEAVRTSWETIYNAGDAIARAVELPGIRIAGAEIQEMLRIRDA